MRVAGWVNGEVWVEVKVVDGWRQGGVWASGWRWHGVAASGLGTSHIEAACRLASTECPRQKEKLYLKYRHWLTVFFLTHASPEMGMNIDKC